MKTLTLILTILISISTFSQGLNGEVALNESYRQKSEAVAVVDEFSYFASQQNASELFITCELHKVDTLGNIAWSSPVSPQSVEYIEVNEIIPTENGGVYILGYASEGCDYVYANFGYIQKYTSNGALVWTKKFHNIDTKMTGLTLDENNDLHVSRNNQTDSKIYTLNTGGIILDSLSTDKIDLERIQDFTGYDKVAFKEDSIFGFDGFGNAIVSLEFSTMVQDLRVFNDTLYALTSDSIFSFDINFQSIESKNITGYDGYSNLKVDHQKIEFLSQRLNDQTILTLDRQFTLNNVLTIPVALDADEPKDFNDHHFATTINFDLTRHTSIRHLDFSRQSTQDVGINSTDIGIIDIQQTQTNATEVNGFSGVYTIKLWADVLIKNYGNNTLDNCRINHRIGQSFCGDAYYSERFTNLNLAPNDSMWISLGLMHNNSYNFNDTVISFNICAYTSHPNYTTDLNVPNDKYCEEIIFGYVGLDENEIDEINIFPNPTSSILNIVLNKENLRYSIVSMQGSIINNGNVNGNQIDVSNLSPGMYVLQLTSQDGEVHHRKQFVVK